jgi:4-amino-4-deoxy-L-arabinose transferase-like glycosyltransferase
MLPAYSFAYAAAGRNLVRQPMPGLSVSTSPVRTPAAARSARERHAYFAWSIGAVAAITAARLVWLGLQSADLYPDEAQYWFWAQHPALGYYSKPPLVAWVIALTTELFGDSEFAIRLAAPLLHAGTALFVYAVAARLYDRRTGFWSAVAYASLPAVSLSAFIISTDAVLLPCWAVALYAFIRAREAGGVGWWIAVGLAAGVGLLAKYAMAYWLLSAFGYVVLVRSERRYFRLLLAASGLALLIYLPNLWWNWSHGFVSYLHVRDNAELSGPLFHPGALLEFFGSQFGVFGPLFFAALIAIVARPGF